MPLPVQFAAQTESTGPQLDENFDALGALVALPCAAAGTNAITLTPNADTPTVTAYSDYRQFSAVAAASNTAATTARVGSLAALPIYKSSAAGPIPLVGGEIVQNTAILLLYDTALNSGGGGWHLMSQSQVMNVATASIALASITRASFGGGQTVTHILSTTSSISWPSLAPQTSAESIVSLAGSSVGDNIQIGYPASISSQIAFRGYVPNPGSVAVVAMNYSASSITPTPGSYRTTAMGFI